MATYLNGVTDYIPQIQPFKPDFNFFQSALEKKQLQYQAGYDKISKVYGQLLNSNLLRQANKDRRDELFTQIDSEIQRLSGVDLSLNENVQAASTLFQPLIDNDYFRKDLAFTKQYESELKKAGGLRRRPDPKSDLKWWQEGETALHYQAQDFAKSTDQDSIGFNSPRYVPFINTTEMLFKFAKENNIDPTSVSFNNGFIFKYKNGEQAVPVLQSVFSSMLGNDPRVKDMTNVQAYLDRKNYISQNSAKFNGDEYAAETEYLKNKVTAINTYFKGVSADGKEKAQKIKNTKSVIEKKVQQNGVNPAVDQDLINLYDALYNDEQIQDSVNDQATEALTNTDAIQFDDSDREGLRYRVDNAMSSLLMHQLASDTAKQYAMAKADVDVKENPFAVAAVNHNYRMIENQQKFEFDKYIKMMDIATQKAKSKGESSAGASYNPMNYIGTVTELPGKGNVDKTDVNVQETNQRSLSSFSNDGSAAAVDNANAFLTYQNNLIKYGTPEEKALAEQNIKEVLGEYSKETSPEVTYTHHNDDIKWGQLGTSLLEMVGGAALVALSGVGEIASFGAATPLAAAGASVGVGTAAHGAYNFGDALYGTDEQVVAKAATVSSKGMVVKQTDGTYKLTDVGEIKSLTNPNSGDYYINLNKRVKGYADQYMKIDPNNPSLQTLKTQIDSNSRIIAENDKLISAASGIIVENNTKLSTAIASQAGVSVSDVNNFFTDDKLRTLSETEFIQKYVQWMSRPDMQSKYNNPSQDDIIDYASDLYDDITESYEDLKKDPDANIGIKPLDPYLPGDGGINRFFGKAATYAFDSAAYDTPSFQMAMDFLQKDLTPKTTGQDIMGQNGVKVIKGSGFNITDETYNATSAAESEQNANILKAFLSSAMINQGGKTGENVQRPAGTYHLHAVSANNSDKVAMTWEISPEWIKDHAGTDKSPGLTHKLNKDMGDGSSLPQITFIMDADKAASSPFKAMQMTKPEMIMNMTGSYDISSDNGNIQISKNAMGGYNYNGKVKAFNNGQEVEFPIFGTYNSEDFNALNNKLNQDLQAIDQGNLLAKNSFRANNPGTSYNLQQQ
jgi:hypothetical protein